MPVPNITDRLAGSGPYVMDINVILTPEVYTLIIPLILGLLSLVSLQNIMQTDLVESTKTRSGRSSF